MSLNRFSFESCCCLVAMLTQLKSNCKWRTTLICICKCYSQLLLNNIWISRVIPGTWLWRITVYSLSWINWGRRCIAAPLPALIRTGSSNQAKCDRLRWVAVCLCTSVGRDGVCQWGLNDPHRARQAWISLFPLPLRCSLWEDHWMVEVYKRVESERWHGLSRLSKLERQRWKTREGECRKRI